VRHDVIQLAAGFAGVMHRHDVRMGETRYGLDFLEKSLGPQRRRDILIEDLYRNRAVMSRVTRQVDGCHPAAAKLILYSIAVAEGVFGSGQFVGSGTR
jgi:hypothetical protein